MFTPLNRIPGLELYTVGSGKYAVKNLEGPITLNCWRGFQCGPDLFPRPDSAGFSEANARITLGGDMICDDPTVESFHINAYNHLMEFQEEIQEKILLALLDKYKKLREFYNYDETTAETFMPEVDDVDEFRNLISLNAVHLLNVSSENIAYVGYEFCCTWDDEHGLGVMTHKKRIVEIGDASTSFLNWIADKDLFPEGENNDSVYNAFNNGKDIQFEPKKPWWKFW